uniref:Uncharacterized protein n=1 Tax=viral metagenome TaxID=1070528 RepID=A0A6C0LMU0_9ZZZZ
MRFASTINLTIIVMMIIIYLNEMRNISMFIFNFNYIKDLAKIIMNEKCNSIYCEAETDRYQIAKNSYNLLMPNDVFNAKTYIIFTFIISIMIFIYYYSMLVDFEKHPSNSITITILFICILVTIIFARYTPYDEQGYLNYYKNLYSDGNPNPHTISIGFVVFFIVCVVLILVYQLLITKGELTTFTEYWNTGNFPKFTEAFGNLYNNKDTILEILKLTCFFISITLVFNLMNIVMSFRNNTTPMLKTKALTWSLQNSLKTHEGYKITETNKKEYLISQEYDNITKLTETEKDKNILNSGANISSALDILIAFEELTNVVLYGHTTEANTGYVSILKEMIDKNFTTLKKNKDKNDANKNTSELSLIFDKKVSIPNDYGTDTRGTQYDHYINKNDNNEDYEYTADISYGNPNVFYEKYWDVNDTEGEFLDTYHYFVPTNLNLYKGANLYRILTDIAYFIIIISVVLSAIYGTYSLFNDRDDDNENVIKRIWDILFPLFALVIFLTFIIVFIRFNTNFNKNVVYKCLDCSYKRALNKLNNIVNPYIRMYDTKITTGNKNYLHHYIISNVFYSLLSGNINLVDVDTTRAINTAYDGKNYKGIDEIKTNRLKLTEMNDSLLNNDNQFREYYKSRYGDLYNTTTTAEIDKLYTVFLNIFGEYKRTPVSDSDIEKYFKTTVLKKDTILKIFSIIKRCFELFNVERFNNNLVYYNNRDKGRGDSNDKTKITIDSFKPFKFYKDGDKLIPHKFILVLTKKADYDAFVGDTTATKTTFETVLKDKLGIKNETTDTPDMTPILNNDITDEDSINPKEDIRDKNVIKIIAKYLLILGHLNYNGVEYKREVVVSGTKTQETVDANRKKIYELKTLNLYKLISNVSYNDTYDGLDDTFITITDIAAGSETGKITEPKYKTLTYIYNYLETKYVSLSSNNNKNYLLNVIQSVNNTLNNDDKTIIPATENKTSKYIFADYIKELKTPLKYEDEDEILNKAIHISTTSFETTYYMNILILGCYIFFTTIKSV